MTERHMNPDVPTHLEPDSFRALLPQFLANNVQGVSPSDVMGYIQDWSSEDYARLLESLRTLGDEIRVYPADPACRSLARKFMGHVLTEADTSGLEGLRRSMDAGPTVILTNHLSYIDAMATDAALVSGAGAQLADRVVYLAGPKVYQDVFRLVAAAAIHSLPVPQSGKLGHTEQLPKRELAKRAIASVEAGQAALESGLALLFYPEGSRTRSGRMGPFLQATRRYLRAAEFVVPAAIVGTENIFGVNTDQIRQGSLSLRASDPIDVRGQDGRDVLISAHRAIAALLPTDKRPLSDADALL